MFQSLGLGEVAGSVPRAGLGHAGVYLGQHQTAAVVRAPWTHAARRRTIHKRQLVRCEQVEHLPGFILDPVARRRAVVQVYRCICMLMVCRWGLTARGGCGILGMQRDCPLVSMAIFGWIEHPKYTTDKGFFQPPGRGFLLGVA